MCFEQAQLGKIVAFTLKIGYNLTLNVKIYLNMWIQRTLATKLKEAAQKYPVVTLTGPRQSGKTTLVRMVFPEYQYISLEKPDERSFAQEDPRGFLNRFKEGVILDEVQRVPTLFSYIQGIVDERNSPGQYILTGSHNFLLHEKISQSLAGRTAVLYLLPFSKRELFQEPPLHPDQFPSLEPGAVEFPDLWEVLFKGFYPRIHHNQLDAREWLADYYQTYIERDVRLIVNIGDLLLFDKFIRLCAGRNGQLVNFSTLAADAGISTMTAKRWLSVLQASFIVALVPPHYRNFRKRLIKSPKLYFFDTGLLAFLLGARTPEELAFHALRGAVFESFVYSELYKAHVHSRLLPSIYFWHDFKGHEVDFILERGPKFLPIEAKSGETLAKEHFRNLLYYRKLAGEVAEQPVLIYGGSESYIRQGVQVLSWKQI